MSSELNLREQTLIDACFSLAARLDEKEICAAILDAVERLFAARSSWILLYNPTTDRLVTGDVRGPGAESYADLELPGDHGIVGLALTRGETVFVPDVTTEERWFNPERVQHSGLKSAFTVPLVYHQLRLGVLGLDSPRFTADAPPTSADRARLCGLAAQAALALRNARLFHDVESDRSRLRRLVQERRDLRNVVGHLRHEVRDARAFTKIIGKSESVQQVLSQIDVVAPADTSVLIVGETGTGKEVVARAIHDQSRRARNSFVAVNCAALPEALVESELFGHEKGAFTGAQAQKLGKFELAERGTLFLDEIGDLPSDAQAKLLRVLQEREVQRVGGTRPVPVNVRVVAATNQDLAARMEEGRFRTDLFYRLNVFPIRLAPLRERRVDIPLLVNLFVTRFAERLHKSVARVDAAAMERLVAYDWPGNVRELQNIIERAVIVARGPVITPDLVPIGCSPRLRALPRPAPRNAEPPPARLKPVVPFSEAERQAILQALAATEWRISGEGGAADILGLKPTTLHAKMKKLGIQRPSLSRSA